MARRLHERFQSAAEALNTLDLIEQACDAAAAELGIVVDVARIETAPIAVQRLASGTNPPVMPRVATVGVSVAHARRVATTSSTESSPIPTLAKGTRAWLVLGGALLLGVVATYLAMRGADERPVIADPVRSDAYRSTWMSGRPSFFAPPL
jgi:hypothetical protein